jgi:zinc transport system substrate-binding protein
LVKENEVKYIYYEELITPRIAEVVARETGTQLLFLHGAHNISRDDLEKGATFISIMEHNLTNLRKGLECR